jgi:hypothetical protein
MITNVPAEIRTKYLFNIIPKRGYNTLLKCKIPATRRLHLGMRCCVLRQISTDVSKVCCLHILGKIILLLLWRRKQQSPEKFCKDIPDCTGSHPRKTEIFIVATVRMSNLTSTLELWKNFL